MEACEDIEVGTAQHILNLDTIYTPKKRIKIYMEPYGSKKSVSRWVDEGLVLTL